MIIKENIELNSKTYTKSYSDVGFMIRKIGTDEIYSEAWDVLDFKYEETDMPIESVLTDAEKQAIIAQYTELFEEEREKAREEVVADMVSAGRIGEKDAAEMIGKGDEKVGRRT